MLINKQFSLKVKVIGIKSKNITYNKNVVTKDNSVHILYYR